MRNAMPLMHLDGAQYITRACPPIYDDEDYFLALRDFFDGGGPAAALSSEAVAAGAEEEEASGVESSLAGAFST